MFPVKPFRHRSFRNLWIGQTISQFGDACYYLVFLFYAHKVTHNDAVTGMVGAAGGLPFVLFGPLAGVLADRVDRRRILIACDLLSALLLLGVAIYAWLFGNLNVVGIVAVAFTLSSINSFFRPARSASLPRLVPTETLTEANGVMQTSENLMFVSGLAVSTFIIGAIEQFAPRMFLPLACTVNALTFLASFAFVRLIPSVVPDHDETEHPGLWQQIKVGMDLVKNDPVLRLALPMNGINNLVISGFMILYVKTNYDWFGGKYWTLGLIEMSFFATVTAFSIVATKWPIKSVGVAMSLCWGICGLVIVPMGFAHNFWAYLVLNAACGISLPFAWLAMATYLQVGFNDGQRGRVSSTWTAVSAGVQPLGAAVMGGFLVAFGTANTYIVIGLVTTVVSALPLLSRPYRSRVTPLPEPATE